MAPVMGYGLRAEAVLTLNGKDVLDEEGCTLLAGLRDLGMNGLTEKEGETEASIRRRLLRIESSAGGKLWNEGDLTPFGRVLLTEMELRRRILNDQLKNLWQKPTLTCDGLVLRDGRVLLVRRGREPFKGAFALPGGIMEYGESAEDCVKREVLEETGIRAEVVGLVGAFSDPHRDPRGHFVTLLYLMRSENGTPLAGDDAEETGFFDIGSLPPLGFDHDILLAEGLRYAKEHDL